MLPPHFVPFRVVYLHLALFRTAHLLASELVSGGYCIENVSLKFTVFCLWGAALFCIFECVRVLDIRWLT